MNSKYSKVLFITSYIAILLVSLIRILCFETGILNDRATADTNKKITAEFLAESVSSRTSGGICFTAKLQEESNIDNKVYVIIKGGESLRVYPGDTFCLKGEFDVPEASLNPYGYDFARTVKSKGASVVFYSDVPSIIEHRESPYAKIYSLRNTVSDNMYKYLDEDSASVADAIVTGNRDRISAETSEIYKNAGIYHIVAVSGLHLGMVLIFITTVLGVFTKNSKGEKPIRLVITLISVLFLLIFTGFGISMWRAGLMAVFLVCASIGKREYSPFVSLYIVANGVIISEPCNYLDPAMHLSFMATLGILCANVYLKRFRNVKWRFKSIKMTFIMCLFAFVFTLPPMAFSFGGVSLSGIFCNVIVLAIAPYFLGMSYVHSIICLIAPEFLCTISADILGMITLGIRTIAQYFASLPISHIDVNFREIIIIFAEIGIGYMLFKKRPHRFAIPALFIFILANILPVAYNISQDKVTVTFLNAGQGESCLIEDSKGGVFMIDCGSESHSSIGYSEVIPYLKNTGTDQIDILFVTHYHTDHTNGIEALINNHMVKKVILPERKLAGDEKAKCLEILALCSKQGVKVQYASLGDVIKYNDRNVFYILNPLPDKQTDANNGSMVIEYNFKKRKVLFLSDIEEEAQRHIANEIKDCDIIKVPHHGGYAKTGFMISSKAKAEHAVISCGKNNKYGHPSKNTLALYSGSKIYTTQNGPVIFELTENNINVR